ncbi:MAG: DedA family protein [Ignavibacterium album]|uniref:DedA family protein n=1 Tax=Ignavibacterium album TaxID=591197 RepID=UPI0026EF0FC1|nr:DedA family protein [Ignavibacterium album]MBI5661333.1 DedA family protein [Ignavibacterium album]
MFEEILTRISELSPIWIYLTIFFFAFIENLFPPSPSDMVIVVGGSLVGASDLHFVPVLIFATGGSLVGFLTAFAIGWQIDKRILHSGKIKFLTIESVEKVENAFRKYGYFLIIANRFLPGTRAVISFFAGMSRLNVHYTVLLSAASALIWNSILISLGIVFGENIQKVDAFLSTYNQIVIAATAVVIIFLIIRYFVKKSKKKFQN